MKYIGYFDCLENKEQNRKYVLSATNKMEYIARKLVSSCEMVEIVSASGTKNIRGICRGKSIKIDSDISLKLFTTFGTNNRILNVFARWGLKISMLAYILRNTKRGEPIIVYHSLGYMEVFKALIRLKKLKLILEVEEIYGDVINDARTTQKEMEFFKCADAYIFPTELLNKKINKQEKQHLVIHGTYQAEKVRISKSEYRKAHNWDEQKVHVVYAGTLDPRKGGTVAAAAAKYLPENYHIHILGFGSETDVQNMQKHISEIADECLCKVTYDGLMAGEDYIQFIQSCDIGLSTQNPDATFNETSFPSKILSYMANGLRVVSIRIPAIEESAIGQ